MIEIDQSYVDAPPPNAAAIKNGHGLVSKAGSSSSTLRRQTLLRRVQGERGVGLPDLLRLYSSQRAGLSVLVPQPPVPVQALPGPMYAYVEGKAFAPAPVPEDVAAKREKVEKRVEKKQVDAEQAAHGEHGRLDEEDQGPAQGLDLLEKLAHDLVRAGHGHTPPRRPRVKSRPSSLATPTFPAPRRPCSATRSSSATRKAGSTPTCPVQAAEAIYGEALDQLARLHSLVEQGRAYLEQRLEDPELKPETETTSPPGWDTPGSSANCGTRGSWKPTWNWSNWPSTRTTTRHAGNTSIRAYG